MALIDSSEKKEQNSEPRIVYFSSVTENTKRFVDKLPWKAERIPLHSREDALQVDYDYILIIPTYGAGNPKSSVPKQVVKFLKPIENRNHCVGIIGGGNRNFGENYFVYAAKYLSHILKVENIYNFEVLGNTHEVKQTIELVSKHWEKIQKEKTFSSGE